MALSENAKKIYANATKSVRNSGSKYINDKREAISRPAYISTAANDIYKRAAREVYRQDSGYADELEKKYEEERKRSESIQKQYEEFVAEWNRKILEEQAQAQDSAAGTNKNLFKGLAGIGENALAGVIGTSRDVANWARRIPFESAEDFRVTDKTTAEQAYYDAIDRYTKGQPLADTRTKEQRELDEFMGIATPEYLAAKASDEQAKANNALIEADIAERGVPVAANFGRNYEQNVAERYSDMSAGWQGAQRIAQVIGQQIPATAVRYLDLAVPGLGTALSSSIFYASADQSAYEQALNEGSSHEDAVKYGALIGSIEAATEQLGEAFASVMGLARISDVPFGQLYNAFITRVTDNKFLNAFFTVVGQMNSEGIEEVVADLVEPFAKSVYNGKSGSQNWQDDVSVQTLWEDYLAGAISGGIMSGVSGAAYGTFRAQNEARASAAVQQANEEALKAKEEFKNAKSEFGRKSAEAKEARGSLKEARQTAAQTYSDVTNYNAQRGNRLQPTFVTNRRGETVIDKKTGLPKIAYNKVSASEAEEIYSDPEKLRGLIEEAKALNPNSALAASVSEKVEAGEKVSGNEILALWRQVNTDTQFMQEDASDGADGTREETRPSPTEATVDETTINGSPVVQTTAAPMSIAEFANSAERSAQRLQNAITRANAQREQTASASAETAEKTSAAVTEKSSAVPATVSKTETVGETEANQPSVGENAEIVGENDVVAAENAKTTTEEEEVSPSALRGTSLVRGRQEEEAAATSAYSEGGKENAEAASVVSAPERDEENAEAASAPRGNTVEELSKSYGDQAGAFRSIYQEGQDPVDYDIAFRTAYDYGQAQVGKSYLKNVGYLTEAQKELAYEAGAGAQEFAAKKKSAENGKRSIAKKPGERYKGTVKLEGMTAQEFRERVNDQQRRAYDTLSFIAEATGIDIVLYASELDENGNMTATVNGKKLGANGFYDSADPGKIYIDINAGLEGYRDIKDLQKYVMLSTFCHETVHFIENWSPEAYNTLRKVVFETMTQRGENVNDLIETKMAETGLSYEKASREVVAESMTEILPDARFAENIANRDKNLFRKLLDRLKEFLNNVRAYSDTLGEGNRSREARALMENAGGQVRYLESIVKLYDNIMEEAVENYQSTVSGEVYEETAAVEETAAAEEAAEEEATLSETETVGTTEESSAVEEAETAAVTEESSETSPETEETASSAEEENIKEEEENGENGREDNRGGVSEPDTDGAGDARLLEEVQAENVQKPRRERSASPDAEKRGAEDTVQYQARERLSSDAVQFAKDIDSWDRAGRPGEETFIVGSTGSVLQGLGAIESDIYMQSDKINTIFDDHPEITIKEIKNLPEILENPVLVLLSKNASGVTNNTRLAIYGMVKAQNNIPVVAIFDLHPVENNFYLSDMQKVVSAYTKNKSESSTMNFIRSSEVMYADKEKTASLLHTAGFQNAYRIEQSGYIGNIAYEDDFVKATGKKFDDVFKSDNQMQLRVTRLTDREVLEYAAGEVSTEGMTDGEKDALRIFKERLDALHQLQDKRYEQGRLYREQQFGANVDRAEAQKTLNRMHVLDDQIKAANDKLLKVESAEVLRRVLKKARTKIEQEERRIGDEKLARWRESRRNSEGVRKYRSRIEADVDTLKKWILHPDSKNALHHVPDALKSTVIPFITSIDFTSKRQLKGGEATKKDQKFVKQLQAVRDTLRPGLDVDGEYNGNYDLPPLFMENLQNFIDAAQNIVNTGNDDFIINQMDAQELRELSKIVKALKKLIVNMNTFHQNAMFSHVYQAGDSSIDYTKTVKPGKTGFISDQLLWRQIRPVYAFERFGDGGKAIIQELQKAQGTLAFNTNIIKAFSESAYTEREIKAWKDKLHTFTLGGDRVTVPVTYIMALRELMQDPDGQRHILEGGLRVGIFSRGNGKNKTKYQDKGHTLTLEDVNTMLSVLTDRQKAVADKLQQFMQEQGARWGNYVSVARYGEELFTRDHYFPINSDGRLLPATADETPEKAGFYALLNMSFTKDRIEGAKNRVVLYDIFDIFANHMSSMAQYNAFALPILDTMKWLNYSRTEMVNGEEVKVSLREELARAYGAPEESKPGRGRRGYAEDFILNLVRSMNGTAAQGSEYDNLGLKLLHNYNMAQVAANLRVAIQQPMSIVRAGMILYTKAILRGLSLSPSVIRQNIREMNEHSGIAAWKDLGFYDVNISRGVSELVKHDMTTREKIAEKAMSPAEFMDKVTWAAMWNACKEQVTRKTRLRKGQDGYFEAVTELFEEVIYKTQVVDSVLTKSEYMRDKGYFARVMSSFMSEPVTTASMVVSAFEKLERDRRSGVKNPWAKNKGRIMRTLTVYALSAALLSIVQSVADALRDDDDYETLPQKWKEALGGNILDELNPLGLYPVLSDGVEVVKSILDAAGVDTYGNIPNSTLGQLTESLVKATEIISDKISGESTNYTDYAVIYKLLQFASGASGFPAAAGIREIQTLWNNSVGIMRPDLKLKTYEPKEEKQIQYSYEDGYLSESKAVEALVENGEKREDAEAMVSVWQFKKENKNTSLTDAMIKNYLSDVKKTGLSVSEFEDFADFMKGVTGEDKDGDGKTDSGSKKEKVLRYINSMRITRAQKDALYYAAGYGKSTIEDAPWH